MKRFATMVALCLLVGLAWGGTFELSDPAAEMQKEQEARDQREAARALEETGAAASAPGPVSGPVSGPGSSVLCTVDTANGACTCIDQISARALSLTRDECVARIRSSLELQD